MSRRYFDRDFKLNAVQLLDSADLPLVQVARSLGIHESMLRRWRNQVRKRGDKAFSDSGRYEHSELDRLRRENRWLRQDLEMLKKTLVLLEQMRK